MDVRQYEICKTYQLLFCDSGCVFNSWNLSWCLGHSFFYPGQWQDLNENRRALPLTEEETAADTDPYEAAPSVEAAASGETLCADTEYVLEEADIVRGTTVETSWKIPHKYIGMNRENFLETMELYAAHPPLSEIERGFVGLEVLSFPREK